MSSSQSALVRLPGRLLEPPDSVTVMQGTAPDQSSRAGQGGFRVKPRMKPGAIGAAVLIAVLIVGLVSHPAIRQDLLAALASQGAASSTSAGSGAQVGAAPQSANLVPNGNFDAGSTSGWGGTNASLKAVSPGFGALGYAAKVTRTAGTSYSMFAKPRPATSVPQAERFQAAAEVSGVAGRSLCLLTREVTSGGSIVQTV